MNTNNENKQNFSNKNSAMQNAKTGAKKRHYSRPAQNKNKMSSTEKDANTLVNGGLKNATTNQQKSNRNMPRKTGRNQKQKSVKTNLETLINGGLEKGKKQNQKQNSNGYKISILGGVEEIGKNMMIVEYGNDMLMIDAGSAFPTEEMPGIDLVVPDLTYVQENIHKLKAILITHGHLDHIGAISYVLKELKMPNLPVYGSRLTVALMENKVKENRIRNVKFVTVKAGQKVKFGNLGVEFFKAQHSISGAFSFAISSPAGVHFHTGDYKIDYTPVDGEGIDIPRLSEISKKGVTVMTGDSTNAERKGFSISEKRVGETIDTILSQNKDKRIFIATFASNVHRVQQLINLAEKYNRKFAFSGRSMINTMEAANKIGEVTFNKKNLIDISNVDKYKDSELLVITTGTQGEPSSALVRMASGDFNKIEIGENDLIILSSSAIPGNEKTINAVMNQLYKRGAEIIYESLANVHTSGHAFQEELKTMIAIINPKFFIPVHGEFRQQRAHAKLANEMGIEMRNILIPDLGDQITVTKKSIAKTAVVPSGAKLLDGINVNDADSSIMRERIQLSEEGICFVTVAISISTGAISSSPELISRGFVYSKDNQDKIEEAKNIVINTILDSDFKHQDFNRMKQNIRKNLQYYFMRSMRRKPLVVPIIIETK